MLCLAYIGLDSKVLHHNVCICGVHTQVYANHINIYLFCTAIYLHILTTVHLSNVNSVELHENIMWQRRKYEILYIFAYKFNISWTLIPAKFTFWYTETAQVIIFILHTLAHFTKHWHINSSWGKRLSYIEKSIAYVKKEWLLHSQTTCEQCALNCRAVQCTSNISALPLYTYRDATCTRAHCNIRHCRLFIMLLYSNFHKILYIVDTFSIELSVYGYDNLLSDHNSLIHSN